MLRRPPRAPDVQIADQPLVLVVDKVGVAENPAVRAQGVAIQGALIDKALDQLRRSVKIPFEGRTPGFDFLVEQIFQVGGAEIAQLNQLR